MMAHNLSHEEPADVHLMYGAAGGNAAEAVRMYRDRFPNRFVPGARMFMAIDRQTDDCEQAWRLQRD